MIRNKLEETNATVPLDRIPEGKKYLDLLDKVAGKDMDDEHDAMYKDICKLIIEKKNLTAKDVEKIIQLSKELSPRLEKAAEALKAIFTESKVISKKSLKEDFEDSHLVKVSFKNGESVVLNAANGDSTSFKVTWYEESEDEDVSPVAIDTVFVKVDPTAPGSIDLREFEARKDNRKAIKECDTEERPARVVNNFNNSLGKYLVTNAQKINTCKNNDDLVNLVSGALGKGNDNYVNRIINDIQSQPSFTKNLKNVYNIILAGYNERVI